MDDIFDKIIAREIPSEFVYEDDICVVIMDKFPVVTGQVLIIPKKHVEYIFDLDDETYHHILQVSKRVAKALDVTYNTLRTCLSIEGFEVPHVHVKLYPHVTVGYETHGSTEAQDEDLKHEAEKIQRALLDIS